MNVFDYVMQMEKDGETFYRDLASKSEEGGLKRIYMMLAEDEVNHYNAFQKLKEDSSPEIAETVVLTNAKTIFAQMKEKVDSLEFDLSVVDLYKKAIEVEKSSAAFYREKAEEMEKPGAKEIFLKIAGDEDRHQHLLENMVIFLSRPNQWIEDAEFNHLDEY